MQVKTFEAMNIKDAVKSIKREFGNDAVILNTKEKPMNDQKGMMVEVTAAVPEIKRTGAITGPNNLEMEGFDRGQWTKIDRLNAKLSTLTEEMAVKSQMQYLETGMQEIKMLLLETLRGKDGSSIKDLPMHLVNIDRTLRTMGIEDVYIAELMKWLRSVKEENKNVEQKKESLEEFYKAQAIRWMLKKIKIAPQWTSLEGATSLHAFVGSSGVGKTSMISKLAAQYHLKKKTKILIASLDNQRLAGNESLRVYAKILGVPFASFENPEELAKRLPEYREMEFILIDTAGYNTRNTATLKELDALRNIPLPIEKHLVLSVLEKDQQMDRAIRYFAPLGIQSLIFTRFDESWSFGNIFNISQRWSLPISFFSTGKNIPDDIERASRERVVERIFGL